MHLKSILIIAGIFLLPFWAGAAWFSFLPCSVSNPDGTRIECYASGDEYFNWLHDADGYTIVQGQDGYYYYGILQEGELKAGSWKVNSVNPSLVGLSKWTILPAEEYQARRAACQPAKAVMVDNPVTGLVHNIVIFIRFSDDTEFTTSRQSFDQSFNDALGPSLNSYYKEVSYNNLDISSTYYPDCAPAMNYSYQDSHSRSYFQPYNAATNPGGYLNSQDRTLREHGLLRDAINWINATSPVPPNLVIDSNNDGFVDNVCFIARGSNGGWSSILWAHSWTLFSYDVQINGKYVHDYTFHPESQIGVPTLCHEMFHTLGAPDLYHYVNYGLAPVQAWDLMASGSGHMGAYMKWDCSRQQWIQSIPEITESGTYTLHPLTSVQNNCYKIVSPYSSQEYFVLEYRKKEGLYEGDLPGSGLLVYRIASYYHGNSNGPPDEVYIFRPDGAIGQNGDPSEAYLSYGSGRTIISDTSNPAVFLINGTPGGLVISNVSSAGDSVTFTATLSTTASPTGFTATAAGTSAIDLIWNAWPAETEVMVSYSAEPVWGNPAMTRYYGVGDTIPGGSIVIYRGTTSSYQHTGLLPDTRYYYRCWAVQPGGWYSTGKDTCAYTDCSEVIAPYFQSFDEAGLPNCWEVQQNVNDVPLWSTDNSAFAGGSPRELLLSPAIVNGFSRVVMTPFQTTGITGLNLTFRLSFLDYLPGAILRVQTSTDNIDWHNASWFRYTESSNYEPPEVVNTAISQDLNSPVTYIAFMIEGALWSYGHICIDDIEITITGSEFYQIQAAASPVEGGMVSGGGYYYPGQTAVLHAVANPGYNFLGWHNGADFVSGLPDYSFQVTGDCSLMARFATDKVNIIALPDPPDQGSTTGSGIYDRYSLIDLNVVPSNDYQFSYWAENGSPVSTTASYSFTAISNRYLTAVMVPREFTVSVNSIPAAGGACEGGGVFPVHQLVTVHAVANEGYLFTGWFENGAIVSALADYEFEVKQDCELVAHFFCPACNLTLLADPPGAGIVSGGGYYPSGEQIFIHAEAQPGWAFNEWTENGTRLTKLPTYNFTIDRNRTLQADFLKIHTIVTVVSPPEGGTVAGEGQFLEGEDVILAAYPNPDYLFINWTESGDTVSDQSMIIFTASGDRELRANFRNTYGVGEQGIAGIEVFPNPCSKLVTISYPESRCGSPVDISLTSCNGNSISLSPVSCTSTGLLLDVHQLPAGLYLLKIGFGNGNQWIGKVVVGRN